MKKPITKKTITPISPKIIHPVFSFTASFFIIICFVLGVYWYGAQAYRTVQTVFRPSLVPHFPVAKNVPQTVYYDPLQLVEAVKKRDTNIVIIDTRSLEEYKKAHVKTAVSTPMYSFQYETIVYNDINTVIKTMKINSSKLIVVYGPSTSFQQQQTVVSELKKNGYNAQLLAVGWNELRHFQNLWLPEPLWGKLDVSTIIEGEN